MATGAQLNCLLSEAKFNWPRYVGDRHVFALQSLEASSPQRFQMYWCTVKLGATELSFSHLHTHP